MILGKPLNEDMQLRPIKYPWAYDLYNQAVANTWFPHEIALGEDLEDWKKMTEDERHAVSFLLAERPWLPKPFQQLLREAGPPAGRS